MEYIKYSPEVVKHDVYKQSRNTARKYVTEKCNIRLIFNLKQ